MRKVDIPLRDMIDIVATCNVLYNLYAIGKDKLIYEIDRTSGEKIK